MRGGLTKTVTNGLSMTNDRTMRNDKGFSFKFKNSNTMKALFIFLVAFFSLQPIIKAQNFIDETKQWAILSTYSVKSEYLYSWWTTYYKFSGDTIINGFSYHKQYMSTDSNQVNWTLSHCPLWFERNDSVFTRDFCCGFQIDTVYLVYDFNLEEGDTFPNSVYPYMIVDSIRYLEWGGSIRKHWFFNQCGSYPYNCLTWIEGVGNLNNFIYQFCLNSLAESLLCFYENDNVVYNNPNYANCYVLTSSEVLMISYKTNISISSSDNGGLIINNPGSEKGVIIFYTIDGRQINELKIESENTQVDLKKSGMIIYKFTNINGKTQTGKFLNVQP